MITETKAKIMFAAFVVGCMTSLQLFAWYFGHNGAVFAATMGISGLVCGSILGFEYAKFKK